jgi:hypothetical protein
MQSSFFMMHSIFYQPFAAKKICSLYSDLSYSLIADLRSIASHAIKVCINYLQVTLQKLLRTLQRGPV